METRRKNACSIVISSCAPAAAGQCVMLPMATATSPNSAQLAPPFPNRTAAHSSSGRSVQSINGSQLLEMDSANMTAAPRTTKQVTSKTASAHRLSCGRRHDRQPLAAARIGGTKMMVDAAFDRNRSCHADQYSSARPERNRTPTSANESRNGAKNTALAMKMTTKEPAELVRREKRLTKAAHRCR